ncbi:N-acetylmuramoyl-L-alanine amidase [Thiomicrorhabdus heinhorstiae]|uniref:N-acetylmuramoyl-L-alanine amidase n=1 Tax=Thiomicrorhabdus heinhorstiae TaxID=2748010 RepID=A0ABS0C1T1_9GAMM|nr:N-acetylmuramoyl-L-alanine amidase [Thiomicrorhabdus heinhorstiae]MBF6058277.1 N-acetylmuramoyl-L-alanine amidase [Thiomicrorhabdus heinhorstiae]
MRSKRYLFKKCSMTALAATLSFSATLDALASSKVASMRIGDNGERLRVVFDVDAPGRYQVNLLDDSRLAVNFYDAENGLNFSKKILGDSRLNAVQIQQEKDNLQVILELQENTRYKAFVLPGKPGQHDRVVVDMNRVSEAESSESAPVKLGKASVSTTVSIAESMKPSPSVKELKVDSVTAQTISKQPSEKTLPTEPLQEIASASNAQQPNGALLDQMAQELWTDSASKAKASAPIEQAVAPSKKEAQQVAGIDDKQQGVKLPAEENTALVEQAKESVALVEMPKESEKVVEPAQYDEVEEQALRDVFAHSADSSEFVVAIDAGHGGKDSGAVGANGLYEKQVTLQMAKALQKELNRYPGIKAVLTRDRDVFIPLHERVKIAKQNHSDIFISIHADSFHDRNAQGGSVYILSRGGASSVMARVLAKSENAFLQDLSLKGRDDDVAYALSDLSREANIRASRALANTVLEEMSKQVSMHKASVQSANFAVLKSIDMPSLLIETAFISNPEEARKLASQHFQVKMASSIAGGLNRFVQTRVRKPAWGETLFVHYRVKKGDTLSSIASDYNLSVQRLLDANRSVDPRRLYVGTRILIPVEEQLAKL